MANKGQYKKAILGTRGIPSRIAGNLGVSRSAVSHYLKKHPDIQELANQEKEEAVDKAEDTIYTLATMDTRDPRMIPTKLKAAQAIVNAQGKDRGWVEKRQLEHSGDGLKIIIEKADDARTKMEAKRKTGIGPKHIK